MESTLLEIVELTDGDIVLQRADGQGGPLINIKFSDKTRAYMPNIRLEIAKAMIQAGIQAFSDIAADHNESDDDDITDVSDVSEITEMNEVAESEEEYDRILH